MNCSGSRLRIPSKAKVSIEVENLLRKMLEPNPDKRISFIELFGHPFFKTDKNYSVQSTEQSQYTNSQGHTFEQFSRNPSIPTENQRSFLTNLN